MDARVPPSDGLDIAIIGMSGRFPGAADLDAFWENLRLGVESIRFFTEAELATAGVDPQLLRDPDYVPAAPVLEAPELFDAAFFDVSPGEARLLDPQRRLLLECAWEALEDAGYDPARYPGSVGVYAGVGLNGYAIHNLFTNRALVRSVGELALLLNGDKDYAATQVSYKLNLTGPSINVQTACSTSLVAVHLARQSLLVGECDMAIAGGSSITVPHIAGYRFEEGSILSPDGHCRAFDAGARGTIFGSGCGLVVLKRLEDALADGDAIRAVIKGSAVNNDGAVKIGFTAPSVEGQAAVVAQALAAAGVEPATIGYVEAHGTGTELGDPIEVAALTQAFRTGTSATGFCALGSLKTNIGHLNTAAGAAGLIKAVLALEHGQIPPTINFSEPNPRIDFENSPFRVTTRLEDWPRGAAPRRAAVSSLGIGGTNAHVILEEAPERNLSPQAGGDPERLETFILSARTPAALEAAADRMANHLDAHPDLAPADVAWTLQLGRAAFEHRTALRAGSVAEAAATLRTREPTRLLRGEAAERRPLVFMFPGQGAQAVGMGRELYGQLPRFREELDRCLDVLRPLLGVDLRDLVFASGDRAETAALELMQTRLTQPVLFAVEHALARQLLEWGLEPSAMIGHSVGEYVAACLAGVFSLEDALSLVVARGRLMQAQPPGAMLSVALSAEAVAPWLSETLSVAAVNAPQMCVVAGRVSEVQALQRRLEEAAVGCLPLRTSHAFHSALMDEVVGPFATEVARVPRSVPGRRLISNVTGGWLGDEAAVDPMYWARHLRAPVQFGPGLATLLAAEPEAILVEVGPGRALSTLARQQHAGLRCVTTLGAAERRGGELGQLDEAVAQLWVAGAPIDWAAIWSGAPRRRVPLPTYPFQRQRHWVDPGPDRSVDAVPAGKKSDLSDWFYMPSWKRAALPVLARAAEPRTWLVFADDPVGLELAEHLDAAGDTVVQVRPGPAYARPDERTFVLDPRASADYQAMVGALVREGLIPDRVVQLWSLGVDAESGASPTPALFRAFQERGFYSVLHFARALGRHNVTQPVGLMVVTQGLHDITGGEPLRPEQGTLVGQCKVVQQEYHNLACRIVDVLVPPRDAWQYAGFLDAVLTELRSDDAEMLVAHRYPYRWVQAYEPVRVEADVAPLPLRKSALYAFDGGLVGIGLALAGYLADEWDARLLFLEDAAFPTEARWDQWLAQNDPQHLVSLKIRAALGLRGAGAQVIVAACCPDEPSEAAAALAEAEARFGALRGVVHAAAGSSAGRINTITDSGEAECERNFSAVAHGLMVLDALTRERDLDIRLALGSLGSVLGGVGYVSFGAASSFMSAFAQWHNREWAQPWMVQSWDSWTLEWELDERIMTLIRDNLTERILPTAITLDEGLECFRRLFALRGAGQVAISATDLTTRYDRWVRLRTVRAAEAEEASVELQPRPALEGSYLGPRNATEKAIVEVWEEMLGIAPIGIHDNFYELGGHSLLATQVVARLRRALATDVSLAAMFEDPTVASLASVVMARRAVQEVLESRGAPSS